MPELNVLSSSVTFDPSFFSKMPDSTPTMADAWVTLGK